MRTKHDFDTIGPFGHPNSWIGLFKGDMLLLRIPENAIPDALAAAKAGGYDISLTEINGDRFVVCDGSPNDRLLSRWRLCEPCGEGDGKLIAVVQKSSSAREEYANRLFGCGWVELMSLNQMLPVRERGSRAWAYLAQRDAAKSRGIGWSMTFPDWISIWEKSGQLEKRGKGAELYVMARKGDIGPYEKGNVYIATGSENLIDYHDAWGRKGPAHTKPA